jgi:hypothetical protein
MTTESEVSEQPTVVPAEAPINASPARAVPARRCASTTRAGRPCRMPAVAEADGDGRTWCLNHHPNRVQEIAEARRRGGVAATTAKPAYGLDNWSPDLSSPEGITKAAADAAAAAAAGKISSATASSIASLLRAANEALSSQLDVDLRELAKQVEEQRNRR